MSDRTFATWVSGFTDGEGCFHLKVLKRKDAPGLHFVCTFQIGLRADDAATLLKIQAYFGCGAIRPFKAAPTLNSKPRLYFTIDSLADNIRVVLPHFDRYPLRSKKERDYAIYREAVLLRQRVAARKKVPVGRHRSRRWTESDEQRFIELKRLLEEGRKFREEGSK